MCIYVRKCHMHATGFCACTYIRNFKDCIYVRIYIIGYVYNVIVIEYIAMLLYAAMHLYSI